MELDYAVNETGCWLFTGVLSPSGYGKVKRQGKTWQAHRWQYTVKIGPIPIGALVCHKCDVRNCINPEHLWLSTPLANVLDMISKGRKVVPQASWTHCSKGHEFTSENTRLYAGRRHCRICARLGARKRRARHSVPSR